MEFSLRTRNESIKKMKEETLDLLIIGGGITGAGVALQAAGSGMVTGLIEMQDFAQGTSSRSTKLVHGGIRYLKDFKVEVVSDIVQERAIVQKIAPHIPKPERMLLPIYEEEGASFNMFRVKLAMDLYDTLSGLNDGPCQSKVLSAEEVAQRLPNIKKEGLIGGGEYLDYNNNDIRLVIENIKRASQDGAYIASRVEAIGFIHDDHGRIEGVVAKDKLNGEEFTIKSRLVINTTGPWSDKTRQLDKTVVSDNMRPTKGVHLVVDWEKLPVDQPIYSDSGFDDGRMVFVIPRGNKTYFGTTDTVYEGDLKKPQVDQADVDYLLGAVNYRFPTANITIDDIESAWAGIRPLLEENSASDYNGGDSGKISDECFDELVGVVSGYLNQEKTRSQVEFFVSNIKSNLGEQELKIYQVSRGSALERDHNGLLTLSGGKITDYRRMGQGAMELIRDILSNEYGRHYNLIDSTDYPVSGGDLNPATIDLEIENYSQLGITRGISREDSLYLARLYGSNAPLVYSVYETIPEDCELSVRNSLSMHYAMKYEMALTPADFLLRRTNIMLFMRDDLDDLFDPVVNGMQSFYGWTDSERDQHARDLEEIIKVNDLDYLK